MHSLLKQQIVKFFGSDTKLPEDLSGFVAAINESYSVFDNERETLQRAMEVSSEELKKSNSELRAMFLAIPDLILKLDRDGNVITLKATENADAPPPNERFKKRQICKTLSELPNPAIRERFQRALRELFWDGEPKTFEYSVVTEFGETFFEVRLLPMLEESAIAVVQDITPRKQAVAEREQLSQQLIKASRQAGMAEVATGVLHNVGNVLNSVNVSASLLRNNVDKSQIPNLLKATNLLRDHAADTVNFLTNDPKGQRLPAYLIKLGDHLASEQLEWKQELEGLGRSIEHIKEIVAMQQSYARVTGITEVLDASELVEDALRMNEAALSRDGVTVVREFQDVPLVGGDKHKALQILINLISNARYAMNASGKPEKNLSVSIGLADDDHVSIRVRDNGTGIAPENLARIFQHGFTTKKDGHGFGLHSSANAAREMGGSLFAHSEGPGMGALFTFELPITNSMPLSTTMQFQPAQTESHHKI